MVKILSVSADNSFRQPINVVIFTYGPAEHFRRCRAHRRHTIAHALHNSLIARPSVGKDGRISGNASTELLVRSSVPASSSRREYHQRAEPNVPLSSLYPHEYFLISLSILFSVVSVPLLRAPLILYATGWCCSHSFILPFVSYCRAWNAGV